jgi:predicted ABC-type ATPase
MTSFDAPVILVLAGVNGAGKSSILGSWLQQIDLAFFNPDVAAAELQRRFSQSIDEANAHAWADGRSRLEHAIETRTNYAFESTLGGNAISGLLIDAAEEGFDVSVWFVGLSSPEQHLARVRARVAAGGHDIPEEKIRERWDASRLNLIRLMPFVAELRVFDNSAEGDPASGTIPELRLLLHFVRGEGIVAPTVADLVETPEWAKAIVAQAWKLSRA